MSLCNYLPSPSRDLAWGRKGRPVCAPFALMITVAQGLAGSQMVSASLLLPGHKGQRCTADGEAGAAPPGSPPVQLPPRCSLRADEACGSRGDGNGGEPSEQRSRSPRCPRPQ